MGIKRLTEAFCHLDFINSAEVNTAIAARLRLAFQLEIEVFKLAIRAKIAAVLSFLNAIDQ